jgi:multisubunit Na+/H+ antiporter MnhB subunit
MLKRPIHASTVVLTSIALVDMITSLILFRMGYTEANHLFRWLLHFGVAAFVGFKFVFLAIPILVLEYARTINPKSAEQGTWLAVLLYCAFYAINLTRM